MKERISELLSQSLNQHSARKQANWECEEAVLANARLTAPPSSLTRLMQEFTLLSPLLADTGLYTESPASPQPSHPSEEPPPENPTMERLKGVYSSYCPVHEEGREVQLMVSALRGVVVSRPEHYMQAVHAEYQRLGGQRSLGQLEEKLQADLMFLIRRENEHLQRNSEKFY